MSIIMDFGTIKTAVEKFKEDAFEGTYFRDIYSRINCKYYKKNGNNLMS